MKVVIVVPDGMGIRNFLYTRFLDLLVSDATDATDAVDAADADIVAWHVLPPHVLATQTSRPVRFEPLPYIREGLAARVLRQAKIYSQLHWRYEEDAAEVMLRFRRPTGGALARTVGHAAHLLGRLVPTPAGAAWLDRSHAASVSADELAPFEAFLRHERPDVVFCTHQRASRAVPAMLAARRLGIPTATFIYSWDNLPKGRMAVHADHALVWSDAMKAELLLYYPEMEPRSVHVVGTPQLEPHLDPALARPREEFLRGLGLDPARKVVCFSGDDEMTSPLDPAYLADLAEAARTMPEPPQILFRRAPTDVSGRYDEVLARFPEIAVCDPAWEAGEGDWTQVVPLPADPGLLANVARHCDAVVNLGSTMGMDFAVFDKPAVYVAYNPPGSGGRDVMDLYRLPHFRCVHALQPVLWAHSAAELGTQVGRALAHPEEKREARDRWLREVVAFPLDRASERCADVLKELAS